MKVPVALHAVTGTQAAPATTDDDLMEALGYFSEDVTTSAQVCSPPLVIGRTTTSSKLDGADSTDEALDSVLLSLEIQELLSSDDQSQVASLQQRVPKAGQASDSPGQSHEQKVSPKKVDRRLKPYSTSKRRDRKRPKHELDYLRAKVVELQEELESLGQADASSPQAVGEQAVDKTGGSSWKEVAERQKQEVDGSVAENRKLRNRLLGQLQVARVLEAAINEHQKGTGASSLSGVGRPFAMNMTDQQIFAQLNGSLESQFAEVNMLLTTKGLSNVLHKLQGGFHFKRQADSMSFRHEEARLLPFSVPALHHALWNCLHNGAVGQTQAQLLSKDHSNLIFRETLEFPRARQVNITKRAAFRRHFEEDRVVFIWSSYVEIDGSVSLRLREKGWSTCSAFDFYRGVTAGASSSSNSVRGCMARMAVQLTPEVSGFRSEHEAQEHIGDMTDLIVGTYHHNFGLIHEVVEKILLTNDSSTKTEASNKGDGYSKVVFM